MCRAIAEAFSCSGYGERFESSAKRFTAPSILAEGIPVVNVLGCTAIDPRSHTCFDDSKSKVAVRPQLITALPAARAAATRTSHRSSLAPIAATARTSRSKPCSSPVPASRASRCSNRPVPRQSSDNARERDLSRTAFAPIPPPPGPAPLGDSARRAISKRKCMFRGARPALPEDSMSTSFRVCGGTW